MNVFDELWEFETEVAYHDFGRMGYRVVYLPEHIREKLPFAQYPRLRVDAEVNEYPLEGAFVPGQGKHYLLLSKRFLKQATLSVGDRVSVNFKIADQDAVSVPDELSLALRHNQDAQTIWESLTPGKQRGLAYRVSSARTALTRSKRVIEVISTLLEAT